MPNTTLNKLQILETVLSSLGQGVVAVDKAGAILFCNRGAISILGMGEEKVALEQWPERYGIYMPDGITMYSAEQSPLVRAIAGENAENLEVLIRNRMRSGRPLWCSMNLRPMRNDDGEIAGAILLIQDVSERKQLAEELARSNAALQQFATVAAHDLQEPLRSIAGFAEMLAQHQTNLDEKSIRYMSKIKDGIKRMQALINNLLNYSRIQTKPQVLTAIDCNEILELCLKSLSGSIEEGGAKVAFDSLPTVLGDASQLSQLFQNLVGNALKFSAEGRPPVVRVSVKRLNLDWQFAVEDNGIGIAPEFVERIFLIFQRLHTRTAYSGTGIGLAICQEIVARHGGRIWVESEPGCGSTFYFTIPINLEEKN